MRRLCSAVLMLGAVLASPVQALGLLEAYDLAVRYDECFQCMDCVVIHNSDTLCAPRIMEIKRARTIPIVSAH